MNNRRPIRIALAVARHGVRSAKRRIHRLSGRSDGLDTAYYEALYKGAVELAGLGKGPDELQRLLSDIASEALSDSHIHQRIASALKEDAPRMQFEQRRRNASFEKRLYRRWGSALDLFYCITVACEEIGEEGYRAGREADLDQDEKALLEAVSGLHARACRTALEVHELLEAGFPMGAHARSRTLHELAVVALVLSKFGSHPGFRDIGMRYLAFDHVTNWMDAQEYQKYASQLNVEPLSGEEMANIEAARDEATTLFPDMNRKLGWAGDLPGLRRRTFPELEAIAGLDHLRPYYTWASHEVHANPKGSRLNRRSGPDGVVKLAGRTNRGLADSAQGALIALHQVTSAMLTCPGVVTPSGLVGVQAVTLLLDEACRDFARTEREMRDRYGER
ncbi:DUF5677 domain-containing protein [Promicromonospora sp. NPDC052451]|uniref:DUF5677 domain-containing protein n=1 Tax=Promicromonospora sp. NPDC052451 TaxID=3364407 RepID=UPI0037C53D10